MEESKDLFPRFSPCRWFPDETLYSLCSRHHRMAGNASPRRSALELFGHSLSAPTELGGLEALSNRAFGQLCDANTIVYERTLHPFYRLFMPEAASSRMRAEMLSGAPGALRIALGCDFVGAVPRHSLRACLQCARDDVEAHSVAYWHRDHQWPGAYRCWLHGTALFEVINRPMPARGLAWLLPSVEAMEAVTMSESCIGALVSEELEPIRKAQISFTCSAELTSKPRSVEYFVPAPRCQADDDSEEVLQRHCAMAIAIGRNGHSIHFEEWALAEVYRILLSRRGLLSSTNTLLRGAFAGQELRSSARPLLRLRDFCGNLETTQQADELVRRMLRVKRMPRTPIWHLLLITWLSEDWNAFIHQYEAIAKLGTSRRRSEHWNKPLPL